jgi:hypothetical protein
MSDQDNVIYFYEPEQEGDFISGIPVRDLTQEDIDRLSPVELRELFGAKTYTKANKDGSKPKRGAKAKDEPREPQDIAVPVVEGTYAQPLTYEDAAILPRYGIKGQVAGVDDTNTVHGYLYSYVGTPSVDDLDAFTAEYGHPGNPWLSSGLMFNVFTVSADIDDTEAIWKWASDLYGRSKDPIANHRETVHGKHEHQLDQDRARHAADHRPAADGVRGSR